MPASDSTSSATNTSCPRTRCPDSQAEDVPTAPPPSATSLVEVQTCTSTAAVLRTETQTLAASSGLDSGDTLVVDDTHQPASEAASESEEAMLFLEACVADEKTFPQASAAESTFAKTGELADPHAQSSDATAVVQRETAVVQYPADCAPARSTPGADTDIMGSGGTLAEAEQCLVPTGDGVGTRGGAHTLLAGTVTVSRGALCLAAVALVGLGWSLAVLPWMGSHASAARAAGVLSHSMFQYISSVQLEHKAFTSDVSRPPTGHFFQGMPPSAMQC